MYICIPQVARANSGANRKGVSFLSRFMGAGRKGKNGRNGGKDSDGEESGEGDLRTEGMDADVFSQPIGFIPQFPSPPKYIRVICLNIQKSNYGC